MATTITFNGASYSIPSLGDSGWGDNVSNYLIAIATGSLQKTGGAFTLTSEIDFGATYGIKAPYFTSKATNPSATGAVRLGNTQSIGWRNAGNSADLSLSVSGLDVLTFGGTKVLLSGAIVDADISALAAIALSKLASVTADRVIVSNGSGVLSASSTTTTTLGYLDVSSSLTTLLAGKEPTITQLPINKGGTNSVTALNNNRVMQSSAGAIVEAAAITAARALISDANGIPTHSTVTDAELGYVSGVTSAIQTQINSKEPTITTLPISKGGTNSSTALNNNRLMQSSGGAIIERGAIVANRALASDSNGLPVETTVTDTELGYVSGVTSAIQTQLNAKAPLVSPSFTTPNIGAATGTSLVVGTSPSLDASAAFEVDSTTKGFLPPRMTTTERNAITTPATGLTIYNTTTGSVNVYNGSSWVELGVSGALPTIQRFTSGSGTYTTPANVKYLIVHICGGGGGGGGSNTAAGAGGTGGTGGTSTFGSLLTATGGTGGGNVTVAPPGAPGSLTLNAPAINIIGVGGGNGVGGNYSQIGTIAIASGTGAASYFGAGGYNVVGTTAAGGTSNAHGAGGGGGGCVQATLQATGNGGGSSGYIKALIPSPAASYSYAVGAGGTAGTAGTSGAAGGAGSSGIIIVEEYYV